MPDAGHSRKHFAAAANDLATHVARLRSDVRAIRRLIGGDATLDDRVRT